MDLALCALAIEYIDDRVAALSELRRVLRPDGALVLSRMHPTGDWLRHGGSYFDVRTVDETWTRSGTSGWPASQQGSSPSGCGPGSPIRTMGSVASPGRRWLPGWR